MRICARSASAGGRRQWFVGDCLRLTRVGSPALAVQSVMQCVLALLKLVDKERRICDLCFVRVLIDYAAVLLDLAWAHVHVFCRANMYHSWSRASGMVCLRRCKY